MKEHSVADLAPYDPYRLCVKCGEDDAYTAYRLTARPADSAYARGGEYLLRECRRCGYQWCEAVIGQKGGA